MRVLEQSKYEKIALLNLEVNCYGNYLITITEINEARMPTGKDKTSIYLILNLMSDGFLVYMKKS